MTINAPAQASPGSRNEPSLWPFVSLLLVCILLGLFIAKTHFFVNLSNDKQGKPLFAVSILKAGDSSSGDVTLGDAGIVPETYTLAVQGPGGSAPNRELRIEVTRGGTTVYSGPLPIGATDIGAMSPGDRQQLHITISAPPATGPSTPIYPLDDNFVWAAHPTLTWTAWWIWVLLVIVLGAAGWFAWGIRRRPATTLVDAK